MTLDNFFDNISSSTIMKTTVDECEFVLLSLQDEVHSGDYSLIEQIVTDSRLKDKHPSIIWSIQIVTNNLGIDLSFLMEIYRANVEIYKKTI